MIMLGGFIFWLWVSLAWWPEELGEMLAKVRKGYNRELKK